MFRNHTGRIAATLLLLSTATIPQTALAASYLEAGKKKVRTTYTASLVEMTQTTENPRTSQTLDWRQPSVELSFELPPAHRTSEIVLTLSADPLTRVARNAPLHVQFNNGETVPIRSNGYGFEARIPLDAAQTRGNRNILRITYPTPAGADCVNPNHGAWSIDLAQSSLRISGYTKNRNLRLSEVTEYLEHAALTPKKIGLIAKGADATDMQALAAQGLSLRTPSVPKFSVSKRGTDFNVIMVKRSGLFNITNDPMILNSKGPRIFVPRGTSKELIFTADTDTEILELLEVFATRKLPNTRRPISSIGEMYMQRRLDSDREIIAGRTQLSGLAVKPINARPGEQSYAFSVEDPTSTQGTLMLRVSTTQDTGEDSRLRVSLNGKTLGATKLDKKRKSVAFDIKPSDLNTVSNIVTLSPDLSAQSAFSCPSLNTYNSGYSISGGSRLTLSQAEDPSVTNLAQLASTGSLFAKSESYIALPTQTRDYQAALSVLGQMAKSSGQGFILADYTRGSNVAKDKHLLIIGPSHMVKDHLTGAPQALREAMSGQSSKGDNLLQAEYGRSASLTADKSAVKYAAAQSRAFKINRGGVAALYGSGEGHLTGVISATPGMSFSRASQNLIKPNHWKALQGGVARWTSSSIIMAQTAQSDDGIRKPVVKKPFQFPGFDIPGLESYDVYLPEINWPEFDMPQVSLPDINWADINWPNIDWKNINWPKFKFAQPETEIEAEISDSKISPAVPRLKPVIQTSKPKVKSASLGLRGPFQFTETKPKQIASFHDLMQATQAKWSATQQWFKAKKDALVESQKLNEVVTASDNLQDRTRPAGQTLKSFLMDKLSAKGLVQFGERTVSVYGLILIIAFSLILLLMSLANPKSRLGGRH